MVVIHGRSTWAAIGGVTLINFGIGSSVIAVHQILISRVNKIWNAAIILDATNNPHI